MALFLKSGQGGCEDIVIEDCDVRSSASALKFGTSSHTGFKHIKAPQACIRDTFRCTIAIESVDGAAIEDIDIADVKATNTGGADLHPAGASQQRQRSAA